jgi:hypothetical protein
MVLGGRICLAGGGTRPHTRHPTRPPPRPARPGQAGRAEFVQNPFLTPAPRTLILLGMHIVTKLVAGISPKFPTFDQEQKHVVVNKSSV